MKYEVNNESINGVINKTTKIEAYKLDIDKFCELNRLERVITVFCYPSYCQARYASRAKMITQSYQDGYAKAAPMDSPKTSKTNNVSDPTAAVAISHIEDMKKVLAEICKKRESELLNKLRVLEEALDIYKEIVKYGDFSEKLQKVLVGRLDNKTYKELDDNPKGDGNNIRQLIFKCKETFIEVAKEYVDIWEEISEIRKEVKEETTEEATDEK